MLVGLPNALLDFLGMQHHVHVVPGPVETNHVPDVVAGRAALLGHFAHHDGLDRPRGAGEHYGFGSLPRVADGHLRGIFSGGPRIERRQGVVHATNVGRAFFRLAQPGLQPFGDRLGVGRVTPLVGGSQGRARLLAHLRERGRGNRSKRKGYG